MMARLLAIKLSIQTYSLAILAGAVGILLVIIGYKNKQLHSAHVSLLQERYATQLDSMRAAQRASNQTARKALDAYEVAKNKYREVHT